MTENNPQEMPDVAPIDELMVLERLALRVRQARRQKNWTQPELAKRSGVSLRTYKRFEQSGTGSIETLVRVAYALDRAAAIDVLFPGPVMARKDTLQERVARVQRLAELHPLPEQSTTKAPAVGG